MSEHGTVPQVSKIRGTLSTDTLSHDRLWLVHGPAILGPASLWKCSGRQIAFVFQRLGIPSRTVLGLARRAFLGCLWMSSRRLQEEAQQGYLESKSFHKECPGSKSFHKECPGSFPKSSRLSFRFKNSSKITPHFPP